jgi:hypothetical protein
VHELDNVLRGSAPSLGRSYEHRPLDRTDVLSPVYTAETRSASTHTMMFPSASSYVYVGAFIAGRTRLDAACAEDCPRKNFALARECEHEGSSGRNEAVLIWGRICERR